MKTNLAIAAFFVLSSISLRADERPIDDIIRELQSQFKELWDDIENEHEEFQELYVEGLRKLEESAKAEGNLDLVVAVRKEVAEFATRTTAPTPSTFPELARLQKIYLDRNPKVLAEQKKKGAELVESFIKKMTELQVELTKADRIDDALAVQSEIKHLKEEWGEIIASMGTSESPVSPPSTPTLPGNYQQGLVMTVYPRQETQKGNDGFISYQELIKLTPIEGPRTLKSIRAWGYPPNANAVALGYLKIEQAGEYVFNSNSFYDRNSLYIGNLEKPLCRYRDGEGKQHTITLERGMVPIISIGYVEARGSCRVSWKPPGQDGLSQIPDEQLFHKPGNLR